MHYPIALFDLDGTIIDSAVGITRSVQYALDSFGIKVDDPRTLVHFVGPPLHLSFQKYYHFDEITAREAVEKYREYYRETGIYESRMYDGIAALIEDAHHQGITLVLATSKPTFFARKILESCGLLPFFDDVFGSNLDLTRSDKAEIIRDVRAQYPQFESAEYVMIGDKEHDIIGAHKNSIDAAGVLWGFGSQEELAYHQPRYIVSEMDGLRAVLG